MFSAWLATLCVRVSSLAAEIPLASLAATFRYVEANTALEKLQSDPSTPLFVDGRVLVQFFLAGQRDWERGVLRARIAPQGDRRAS